MYLDNVYLVDIQICIENRYGVEKELSSAAYIGE